MSTAKSIATNEPREFLEVDRTFKLLETREFLTQKQFDKIDATWLADQLNTLAESDFNESYDSLTDLISNLLVWKYEPDSRVGSLSVRIAKMRTHVNRLVESKSLYDYLTQQFNSCYTKAVVDFGNSIELSTPSLPTTYGWDLEQILDEDFYAE